MMGIFNLLVTCIGEVYIYTIIAFFKLAFGQELFYESLWMLDVCLSMVFRSNFPNQ